MCTFDLLQTYAEMDPTTAALEKEHEAVTWNLIKDRKLIGIVSWKKLLTKGRFHSKFKQ